MCLHDPSIDNRVSPTIKRTGCWECPTVQDMLKLLRDHDNSSLLDIGANIGYYSLAAAASGAAAHVDAFEASPRNILMMQQSVIRSELGGVVTLHAIALGAAPGMLRLGVSQRNQGGLHHTEAAGGTQVARMALDSVLAPTTRPVFIKLDVEGAECAVVRGMRNFLRDSAQIIGFAMEVSQSRDCCDEWCSEAGLFGQLHARGLCPWSRGSNSNPKRARLHFTACHHWCDTGASATGDVVWVPCNAA